MEIKDKPENIEEIISKCCVCGKIKLDGEWVYKYIPESYNVRYSHGYCPQDYLKAMRELENE